MATSTTPPITVSSQANINNAIEQLDQTTNPGNYTIVFTGDITEGQPGQPDGIYAISLQSGVTLTIDGGGYSLERRQVKRRSRHNLRRRNDPKSLDQRHAAQGGNGQGNGGGGAGLGGGLFVGATAMSRSTMFPSPATPPRAVMVANGGAGAG